MIDKKTEKADLERRRFLFTEIGLVLALGLVLVGFEYKSYDKKVVSMGERTVTDIPGNDVKLLPALLPASNCLSRFSATY